MATKNYQLMVSYNSVCLVKQYNRMHKKNSILKFGQNSWQSIAQCSLINGVNYLIIICNVTQFDD